MKKIFVFDFDLTLTVEHSGGYPGNKQASFWFGSDENVKAVQTMFKTIRDNNHVAYINTAAVTQQVKDCLGEIVPYLIQDVIGDDNDSVVPYSNMWSVYEELTLRGFTASDPISLAWAKKKSDVLQDILSLYPSLEHKDIYFFDDLEVNVDYAKYCGFTNSFLVKYPLRQVVNTVHNLFKLKLC